MRLGINFLFSVIIVLYVCFILYLLERIFFIHIVTKLLTTSICPIFLMVHSGISEASH